MTIYNISIVGKSNSGKFSLIDYLFERFISPESNKLQTTRINIHNKINLDGLNVDIIDTPGVSLVNNDLLSESMKNSYIKTLGSIDLILVMLDINNKDLNYEKSIINLIKSNDSSILIIVNKIDLANDNLIDLEKIKKDLDSSFDNETFFLSVKSEQGTQQLLNRVKEILLNRTPVSKKSVIPINNNKNIMQEIIRGIIINHTHNELPYDTAVLINKIDEKKSLTSLYASIYVSKENQKKIVIGKGGMMIKKIGTESRLILEKSYDKKFFISLNVLVKDNWKNNYSLLKELGYID